MLPLVGLELHAAGLLLEGRAGLAAVAGLPLDVAPPHPERALAWLGTAAPVAPLAHHA